MLTLLDPGFTRSEDGRTHERADEQLGGAMAPTTLSDKAVAMRSQIDNKLASNARLNQMAA